MPAAGATGHAAAAAGPTGDVKDRTPGRGRRGGRSPEALAPRCIFCGDASASGRGVSGTHAIGPGKRPGAPPHDPGQARPRPTRSLHRIVRVDFRPRDGTAKTLARAERGGDKWRARRRRGPGFLGLRGDRGGRSGDRPGQARAAPPSSPGRSRAPIAGHSSSGCRHLLAGGEKGPECVRRTGPQGPQVLNLNSMTSPSLTM